MGASEFSGEGLVQQGLFQIVQRGEFAFVESGEELGFRFQCIEWLTDRSNVVWSIVALAALISRLGASPGCCPECR